jgi:hypothetical protein
MMPRIGNGRELDLQMSERVGANLDQAKNSLQACKKLVANKQKLDADAVVPHFT